MPCPYANSLGKPGEGVHFHAGGIAVVDLALALLAAWGLARWFGQPLWAWIAGVLATGVVAHRLFGVRTAVDRALFGRA